MTLEFKKKSNKNNIVYWGDLLINSRSCPNTNRSYLCDSPSVLFPSSHNKGILIMIKEFIPHEQFGFRRGFFSRIIISCVSNCCAMSVFVMVFIYAFYLLDIHILPAESVKIEKAALNSCIKNGFIDANE